MKNLSNNKKGFTLIELLAVIVILAILVMLAIPAITRYLTTARQSSYADNASRAIEAVRNDIVTSGFTTNGAGSNSNRTCTGANKCGYNQAQINALLERKLTSSSFGGCYKGAADGNKCKSEGGQVYITVEKDADGDTYTYKICMIDEAGNGIADGTPESSLSNPNDAVKVDGSLKDAGCTQVTTS